MLIVSTSVIIKGELDTKLIDFTLNLPNKMAL